MNRDILDKWCERGILFLILGILVFAPAALGAVPTWAFLVVQGATILVMLIWGIRVWIQPRPQLLWPPICWAVLAFVAYAVIRYLTADVEYVARTELLRVLVYAFLFLAVLNNLHRQSQTQVIVLSLIFLAMAISFYAIYQYATKVPKVWGAATPYLHRGSGTFYSPDHLAGFLEIVLPLALAWLLVSRAKPVLKIFIGYASFAIMVGIAVTVSRAGWFSAAAALAVFFTILLFHRTHRIPSAVLLLVIVGAGSYLVPRAFFLRHRFGELTAEERFNDSARFLLWRPAVELWRENIWWGIGPAHFNYRFRPLRPQIEQAEPDRVHNDYLNTLTDWGIVGVVLVAIPWGLLTAGAFRTWRYVRGSPNDLAPGQSNKAALVLGTSIGLLAVLFHSVADFNMHIPANAILTVTLMAILTGCLRHATERHWVKPRGVVKLGLTVLLMAGMGYLAWQSARRASEEIWVRRAKRLPKFSAEQAAALEKAFEAEPMNFDVAYSIGEAYRVQSWEGGDDYVALATKAMTWYRRASDLDRYHGYSYLRHGMCLDWLGRHAEAEPDFARAVQLDPNGYFTMANVGWHYVQIEDYAAAKVWLERSKRLQSKDNPIADSYLQIATQRLAEGATATRPNLGAPAGNPGSPEAPVADRK